MVYVKRKVPYDPDKNGGIVPADYIYELPSLICQIHNGPGATKPSVSPTPSGSPTPTPSPGSTKTDTSGTNTGKTTATATPTPSPTPQSGTTAKNGFDKITQ